MDNYIAGLPFSTAEFARAESRSGSSLGSLGFPDYSSPRYVLYQDGSCQAENLLLPSSGSEQLIPATLHLSPGGACFVVEYDQDEGRLDRTSVLGTAKLSPLRSRLASRPQSADLTRAFRNRSPSPDRRSSYFRESFLGPTSLDKPSNLGMNWGERDGEKRRHLTATVTSKFRSAVLNLLNFRNTYYEKPFLHAALLEKDVLMQTLQTNTEIKYSRWPVASSELISRSPEGSLTIASIDGSIQLILLPHRQTFTVKFPSLVADPDGLVTKLRGSRVPYKFVYLWIEQTFSVRDAPELWQYPLALLLKQCGDSSTLLYEDICVNAEEDNYVTTILPSCGESSPSAAENSSFRPSRAVHNDIANPKPIRILWTPTAVYRVVALGKNDMCLQSISPSFSSLDIQVEATLPEDGTVMRAIEDLKYMVVYYNSAMDDMSGEGEMYALQGAPPFIREPNTGTSYPLSVISAEMLRLVQVAYRSIAARPKHPIPVRSGKLEGTATVPGLGTFTAYSGGYVRALYENGVVVEAQKAPSIAHVTFPDGDVVTVRCEKPVGCERYVVPVLQFAKEVWESNEMKLKRQESKMRAMDLAAGCIQRCRTYLEEKQAIKDSSDPDCNHKYRPRIADIVARNRDYVQRDVKTNL
ncbi:uncharacterized protein SPPG_03926 [Spizellomyces punctatus DAOM BR117]|uniref:C5orf34-like C-terminal domain-containing protein n=1 Tax=Spizellomyces punctatus (strain DAOM BR117) TaxID=645134 RepID=A0A0L0HIV2_SPIPD|nr:uncharacterized protein SPPG_03926 [Spizellomyces punctatus DAOM BR117]KND00820.1 hypothetical protein SPPG_03926 [Spizellomyces punctatus DAOM BR117]|eukprot:XP_016608859.1 hypothetical protein SPPG_03926 [Spizellomyces punctatus DAOM BR117]